MAAVVEAAAVKRRVPPAPPITFGWSVLTPNCGSCPPRTSGAVAEIGTHIGLMKPHRTFALDPDGLGRAALLARTRFRKIGNSGDSRLRALMDRALFLQALKLGLTVLTANIADFDFLLQMVPTGRVLFYRRTQLRCRLD